MNNYLLETNANDSYDKNGYFMGRDIIASNKKRMQPKIILKIYKMQLWIQQSIVQYITLLMIKIMYIFNLYYFQTQHYRFIKL